MVFTDHRFLLTASNAAPQYTATYYSNGAIMKTASLLAASLLGTLLGGCAGNGDTEVQGERVTLENGVIHVCGEGDGLPECRDYNGETYSENLEYKEPTDQQLESEAAKVRSESPEELERTISEMEQNPGADYTH